MSRYLNCPPRWFCPFVCIAGLVLSSAAQVATAGTPCTCSTYIITSSTGNTLTPGTTNIGQACDDCNTLINLPFPVCFYGTSYSSGRACSNGFWQFTGSSREFSNTCPLPASAVAGPSIMPLWDDLRTDGTGRGIFTSISGPAPNRIFNIEWRAGYFSGFTGTANFEIRLYENSTAFDIIYGTINDGAGSAQSEGASATVGCQANSIAGSANTQFSCNPATGPLTNGLLLHFDCPASLPPTGIGAANPSSVLAGAATLLTVAVTPGTAPASTGLAVSGDLSTIGGGATQQFYDNASNGDVTANDNIFSYQYTIPAATAPGAYGVPFTVSDAQARSTNGTIMLTVDEAGDLPATAKLVDGPGAISTISGMLSTNDADMYRIHICDPANFSAIVTSATLSPSVDTQLFLFSRDGHGVAMNDDDPAGTLGFRSRLSGPIVQSIPAADYYLAISSYDKDPVDSASAEIWADPPFATVRAPDGPGAPNAIAGWDNGANNTGTYTITLTGVSGRPCIPPPGPADCSPMDFNNDRKVDADDIQGWVMTYMDGPNNPNFCQVDANANGVADVTDVDRFVDTLLADVNSTADFRRVAVACTTVNSATCVACGGPFGDVMLKNGGGNTDCPAHYARISCTINMAVPGSDGEISAGGIVTVTVNTDEKLIVWCDYGNTRCDISVR